MTIATAAMLFGIACLIASALVLCIVIAGARAEQISKMNTPSQLAHHLSDNISERRGDGEGISFHTSAITTEVDQ